MVMCLSWSEHDLPSCVPWSATHFRTEVAMLSHCPLYSGVSPRAFLPGAVVGLHHALHPGPCPAVRCHPAHRARVDLWAGLAGTATAVGWSVQWSDGQFCPLTASP